MKLLLAALFLFQSLFVFSQEKEITKILNHELTKELNYLQKDKENHHGQKFDEIVSGYEIKNGILSVTLSKKSYYSDELYLEAQEVALSDILAVAKDINVIFETNPNAVKITETDNNGKITTRTTDLFFTHISYERENNDLAESLVKAFKNNKIIITVANWFD